MFCVEHKPQLASVDIMENDFFGIPLDFRSNSRDFILTAVLILWFYQDRMCTYATMTWRYAHSNNSIFGR